MIVKILPQLIVVLTVAWPSLALAEKNQLPQMATIALEKMNRDIEAAKREAVDTLKKLQKEEMKKGNLQIANMLQEKIDELSPKLSLQAVVGKWTCGGNKIEIFDNGTATFRDKNKGSWTFDKAKSKIVINWDFGHINYFDYPPKNGIMKGFSVDGSPNGSVLEMFKDKEQ
jgi:hypothetical protein